MVGLAKGEFLALLPYMCSAGVLLANFLIVLTEFARQLVDSDDTDYVNQVIAQLFLALGACDVASGALTGWFYDKFGKLKSSVFHLFMMLIASVSGFAAYKFNAFWLLIPAAMCSGFADSGI